MNRDIDNMILQCNTCMDFRNQIRRNLLCRRQYQYSVRLSVTTDHNTHLRIFMRSHRNGISNIRHQAHYRQQANGLTERTVQTAKRLLEKAKIDGKDPYLGVLQYRNTPTKTGSLAQFPISGELRSILPVTRDNSDRKL